MPNILILYTDGSYLVQSVKDSSEYNRILACQFITSLPYIQEKNVKYTKRIDNVYGYISDEGMIDNLSNNKWTEFLAAVGLFDSNDSNGYCIYGNIILVGQNDNDNDDHDIPQEMVTLVDDYFKSENKWDLLKSYTLTYSEKTKCGYSQCTKSGSNFCSKCRDIMYCSKECQKKDWSNHKKECQSIEDKCKQQ